MLRVDSLIARPRNQLVGHSTKRWAQRAATAGSVAIHTISVRALDIVVVMVQLVSAKLLHDKPQVGLVFLPAPARPHIIALHQTPRRSSDSSYRATLALLIGIPQVYAGKARQSGVLVASEDKPPPTPCSRTE